MNAPAAISQIGQISRNIMNNLGPKEQVDFAKAILKEMRLEELFKAVGEPPVMPQVPNRGVGGQFAPRQQAVARSYFRLVK